jgi:hypothetical protein
VLEQEIITVWHGSIMIEVLFAEIANKAVVNRPMVDVVNGRYLLV